MTASECPGHVGHVSRSLALSRLPLIPFKSGVGRKELVRRQRDNVTGTVCDRSRSEYSRPAETLASRSQRDRRERRDQGLLKKDYAR